MPRFSIYFRPFSRSSAHLLFIGTLRTLRTLTNSRAILEQTRCARKGASSRPVTRHPDLIPIHPSATFTYPPLFALGSGTQMRGCHGRPSPAGGRDNKLERRLMIRSRELGNELASISRWRSRMEGAFLARSRSASTREQGEKRDRLWIDVLYRSIGNLVTLSLGASSASKFVPRHFANASLARARARARITFVAGVLKGSFTRSRGANGRRIAVR